MSFIITGSVAYDYLMSYPGRFRDHILPDQLDSLSVSFLADSMRRERGGVAANVAYTNKLLGGHPTILATVGNDFGDYRRWLEDQGLPTDQIIEIPEDLTATFFVSTDLDQNQIANFYTGAMAHARDYSLASRNLQDAALVLISPNDPLAMVAYAKESQRRTELVIAVDASQRAVDLVRTQYLSGLTNFQNVLDSQRTLFQLQDQLAQSEGIVVQNLVLMYRALGGGWDVSAPTIADDGRNLDGDTPQ